MTDTPKRLTRAWRTVDFKPAFPGWRAVLLDPDRRLTFQVPGWLIQARYQLDPVTGEARDDPRPERRVIAGICHSSDDGEVTPIDLDEEVGFFWKIIAPGEPEPTEEEEREERQRRAHPRGRGD